MKGKNIIVWLITVAVAGLFIWTGTTKIFNPGDLIETWERFGIGKAWITIVGVLEVLGAIGLLIPRIASIPAFCLALLMIIAATLSFSHGDTSQGIMALVALGLSIVIFFLRMEDLVFLD